jgi:hypothetical protein
MNETRAVDESLLDAYSQAVVEAVGRRVRVFPGRRRLRYNKPSLANPSILVC